MRAGGGFTKTWQFAGLLTAVTTVLAGGMGSSTPTCCCQRFELSARAFDVSDTVGEPKTCIVDVSCCG
jgi:hypothetical protein